MSKFGTLIDIEIPVLFDFYTEWEESESNMYEVLKSVAAALGDKAKVIRIDIEKNNELVEALRIKTLPTLIIYKKGEMKWRQSGELDANTLISIVNQFV